MTTTESEQPAAPAVANPGRRRMLSGFTLGGAAVAGGVVGATASAASASSFDEDQLELEVACLGNTWREGSRANPADDGDFRAPFSVEGLIYSAGTILGDGFVPVTEGSIGRWICRGYVIIDSTRSEPHTTSHQDYLFGPVTEQDPFPADMLSSVGIEGTNHRDVIGTRAVVGGIGRYKGVTGQVTQEWFADNTTLLSGLEIPSPCFRFRFDLLQPS